MTLSLIEILRLWHDFYSLIGTAAATLVGLMFVAASIGSGVFSRNAPVAMQSFLSPTVVHFSAILFVCLLAVAPSESWESLGLLLGALGLLGAGYSLWVLRRMAKHGFIATIDVVDRLWYALLPVCAYLLVAAAGLGLLLHAMVSFNTLAAAQLLLLLAGIRNAWDMTVWIIGRRTGDGQ